jgi:hypothetical protein
MSARAAMGTLMLWGLAAVAAAAQAPPVQYVKVPAFRIPYHIDNDQPRLKEVQLYASEDLGRNWRMVKAVTAEESHFAFRAERDGQYWFVVRTIDANNRPFPASLEGVNPQLRIVVDTQLPTVTLRVAPPRAEQVGVEWDVRDENLDLTTLQLEYRSQGTSDWLPLTVEPLAVGSRYFTPTIRGPWDIRLRVKDKAENQGTGYLSVLSNGAAGPATPPAEPGRREPAPAAAAGMKVVNTTEFNLNYSLEDVGPSGVSSVELYYTRDGRSWQRLGEDPDKQSPFPVKLPGEGVYGLTMVVKSGVGYGDRPPQPGDAPQMWIEVDLTKPVVQIQRVEPGRGADSGKLFITWSATDKNLGPTPVSIYYAEQAEGPWKEIVTNLDNTGRYVWQIPTATPYRFLVRVEAADRGGNVGRNELAQPVVVDLSVPKGRLIGVDGK